MAVQKQSRIVHFLNSPTRRKPVERTEKIYPLPWELYIRQGYKPFSPAECLSELIHRAVKFGLAADGTFWFDSERLSLTEGLKASVVHHRERLAEMLKVQE